MIVIANAFSIGMLYGDANLSFTMKWKTEIIEALEKAPFRSVVGHQDTAAVLSEQLGKEIQFNRETYRFDPYQDILIVAQFRGPRLPEGTTTLPEGAAIEFWEIKKA